EHAPACGACDAAYLVPRVSLTVAGLAVDDRFEHAGRGAAEDDPDRRILHRIVGGPGEADHREIGALARREAADLAGEPEGPRRVDRREPERLVGGEGVRPRLARSGKVDRRPQLLPGVDRG